MQIRRHKTGVPLSAAELRQRRDAARARWAAAGVVAAGTALGAIVGRERVHHSAPQYTADRLAETERAVESGRTRRAAIIRDATSERLRAIVRAHPVTEPPPVYNIQINRTGRLIQRVSGQAASTLQAQRTRLVTMRDRAPAPIGRQAHVRPPRLTVLQQRQQALALADRQLENAKRDYAGEFQGAKRPERLNQLLTELHRVSGLRDQHAEALSAAQDSSSPVRATVERRPRTTRGGETNPQLAARISAEQQLVRTQRTRLLNLLDRRTASVAGAAREQTIREAEVALRLAARRAGGKGALIAAGLGLTAVGLGILAHHLARHHQARKVEKVERVDPDVLAKARRETRAGADLAGVYRRWIDRLLGKTEDPINLGDGIAEGLGESVIDGFADGARNPPIDTEGSEPGSYLDVDFDLLNPAVRRHMADYVLDRIVEITDAQRETIRDAIMKGSVLQGHSPLEVARIIKRSIGLTSYQMALVGTFEQQLRVLDPKVLERKLRDRRYDGVFQKAMDAQTPLSEAQIDNMVDAYHRRFVALRSRTIARTEALRATSYGGLARIQQMLDENPDLEVTKRWLATDDERTRDTHVDLNGREVDGMLTNFVTSAGNQIRWPLDDKAAADEVINCRCTLQYIFKPKRSAVRGGLVAVAA